MDRPLHILISAYACGPNWGSEIGMGWNWVTHLSQYCKIHAIVEKEFQKDIEAKLPELSLVHTPTFYYNDVGDKGRELFWKQGSFLFYSYYKQWQQRTFKIAQEIIRTETIDLVHQLNMIGFREPGYLWQINDKPFVWGPIGGFNQMPPGYLVNNSIKNIVFYAIKNAINSYQKKFLSRVRKSSQRADVLIAATKEAKTEIDKISNRNAYLMGETGCEVVESTYKQKEATSKIIILWVGRLQAMKALPIALEALAKVKDTIDFELRIAGDGPDEQSCKAKAKQLQIDTYCTWLGRIPNTEVIEEMKAAHLFFFTSIKEGSPHVISESLQNGLPVLCHDACGHGVMVTDNAGRKVPMVNHKTSVDLFAKELIELAQNYELRESLAKGAIERAKELTWDSKAKEMIELYKSIL